MMPMTRQATPFYPIDAEATKTIFEQPSKGRRLLDRTATKGSKSPPNGRRVHIVADERRIVQAAANLTLLRAHAVKIEGRRYTTGAHVGKVREPGEDVQWYGGWTVETGCT